MGEILAYSYLGGIPVTYLVGSMINNKTSENIEGFDGTTANDRTVALVAFVAFAWPVCLCLAVVISPFMALSYIANKLVAPANRESEVEVMQRHSMELMERQFEFNKELYTDSDILLRGIVKDPYSPISEWRAKNEVE